jgi:hypothetical protein
MTALQYFTYVIHMNLFLVAVVVVATILAPLSQSA